MKFLITKIRNDMERDRAVGVMLQKSKKALNEASAAKIEIDKAFSRPPKYPQIGPSERPRGGRDSLGSSQPASDGSPLAGVGPTTSSRGSHPFRENYSLVAVSRGWFSCSFIFQRCAPREMVKENRIEKAAAAAEEQADCPKPRRDLDRSLSRWCKSTHGRV